MSGKCGARHSGRCGHGFRLAEAIRQVMYFNPIDLEGRGARGGGAGGDLSGL
ncbi:hypothetical protein GCM10023075_83400 [Streptosporangium album]